VEGAPIVLFERELAALVDVIAGENLATRQLQPVAQRAHAAEEVNDLWLTLLHQSLKNVEIEPARAPMSRVWHSQTTIDTHPALANSAIALLSRSTFSANFLCQ
jgi:hypothetical protein